MPPTDDEIAQCIAVLEALVEDPRRLAAEDEPTRTRLLVAAGRVSRPSRSDQRSYSRAIRKKRKAALRAEDEAQLARTGIRQQRMTPVFVTPSPQAREAAAGGCAERPSGAAVPEAPEESPLLNKARNCYICKTTCARVHAFYDQMCQACGDFNFSKRSQTADLNGRVALITGARVKIGYQAAILLLRAGARVLVTTRFPKDAALRFAREQDHGDWAQRLSIHGLDLRHTPSVEAFAGHLNDSLDRLDFVLHNACQTVRRPVGFYTHLMAVEEAPVGALPGAARLLQASARLRPRGAGGGGPRRSRHHTHRRSQPWPAPPA